MQAIGPDAVLDVAITGCGPVGALAASLLARYGLSTPVIEREAALSSLPRAVHLDHGMMLPPTLLRRWCSRPGSILILEAMAARSAISARPGA